MDYSLLESANRWMSKDAHQEKAIAETDDEVVIGGEEELEGGDLEGGDLEAIDGEEEEEAPLMPVEAAIRAIQLALNGEVESAEEALDLVQDMEAEAGEDEELGDIEGGDIEGEPEVEVEVEEGCDKTEEVVEGDDTEEEVVEGETPDETEEVVEEEVVEEEEEEVEEETYGESHSKFLRLSQRYL